MLISLCDICNADYVGKYTGRGDRRTGSVTLDQHRVFVITLGRQEDDVVRSFEHVEGVAFDEFVKPDRILAVFDPGDETPALVLRGKAPALLFKSRVEGRQFLPELLEFLREDCPSGHGPPASRAAQYSRSASAGVLHKIHL